MNATDLTQQPSSAMTVDSEPRVLPWIARLVAALILGQTLFFKFTGAPESVAIFETLGAEPWGRIGSGLVELLAVILLLAPLGLRVQALAGALVMGVMGGAIVSHLTLLGIEVDGDGGVLFGMACVTFLAGLSLAWMRRQHLPIVGGKF